MPNRSPFGVGPKNDSRTLADNQLTEQSASRGRPKKIVAHSADSASPQECEAITITFGQAGKIYNVGQTTLWAWARAGEIEVVRPPGLRRSLILHVSLRRRILGPQL